MDFPAAADHVEVKRSSVPSPSTSPTAIAAIGAPADEAVEGAAPAGGATPARPASSVASVNFASTPVACFPAARKEMKYLGAKLSTARPEIGLSFHFTSSSDA